MPLALGPLFEGLSVPSAEHTIYSVAHIPGYPAYFLGKDNNASACLLVSAPEKELRRHAPIRLECLEATFDIPSVIKQAGKVSEGTFTVVRCRSNESEFVRYFLSVAETLLRILGPNPTRLAIHNAITRLAQIFQHLQCPANRSVNGLFGELLIICESRNPFRTLSAWRSQDTSRFDFNVGSVRIDVKTTSGRQRSHTFSYDQCNPPSGTIALVASLLVEQTASGSSLQEIIREIEGLVATNAELVLKLHDTVAQTLGQTLNESLRVRFDRRLSASSLQFYDLRTIPAIRSEPPGVSNIHFRSDLSNSPQADTKRLSERDLTLADFLPDA